MKHFSAPSRKCILRYQAAARIASSRTRQRKGRLNILLTSRCFSDIKILRIIMLMRNVGYMPASRGSSWEWISCGSVRGVGDGGEAGERGDKIQRICGLDGAPHLLFLENLQRLTRIVLPIYASVSRSALNNSCRR